MKRLKNVIVHSLALNNGHSNQVLLKKARHEKEIYLITSQFFRHLIFVTSLGTGKIEENLFQGRLRDGVVSNDSPAVGIF